MSSRWLLSCFPLFELAAPRSHHRVLQRQSGVRVCRDGLSVYSGNEGCRSGGWTRPTESLQRQSGVSSRRDQSSLQPCATILIEWETSVVQGSMPPTAPPSLPKYLAEGLPKQDDDTLREVEEYIDELIVEREQRRKEWSPKTNYLMRPTSSKRDRVARSISNIGPPVTGAVPV